MKNKNIKYTQICYTLIDNEESWEMIVPYNDVSLKKIKIIDKHQPCRKYVIVIKNIIKLLFQN